ncbi:MAG TPA: hypothetical protein VNS09_23890 [Solirubrobacter sp.]|nr:hypothetical protein [Solirubrobacter sp.]
MKRAALALLLILAGCGGPSGDLFEVVRTGTDRNANVTLVVSDDGFVTCDGRRKTLPPDLLLRARQLTRDLSPQAELNLTLPKRPGAVLSYRARMAAGTIAFSDTSRPLPESFADLTVYTKDVAEGVCGLTRP